MTEKLIVLWRGESTRNLSDGLAVYADGPWMLHCWDQVGSEAGCYPIGELVPSGPRLMVWEGEQVNAPLRSPDSEPVFRGTWRAATALDLIDADLLEYYVSASQMLVKLLATHAHRQLPEGYQIALWFDSEGISTQLLDPDETRLDTGSPQSFTKLCELAQADAARRASE